MGLLVFAFVDSAQAQTADPTVTTVAVTSDPGADSGYAVGDAIEVTLTFSQAVTVTGTPQLTFDVGGETRTASYAEGSGSAELVFRYTVAAGDEDEDGIAVAANSLALNGGTIRAGAANAALAHVALQANDHRVDGVAPTVTVGGETRTYVPPGRQFNVVFYFSEKVYGLSDSEITVTNGAAHDVRAPYGNAAWPRYTRWDAVVVPAAEGPVTVTLQAGAATDAYGNGNAAPESALSVIAATPVMVEVTRTTSGFAEGGKAEFIVTRTRDNGAIPVSLSLDQTGDFLSGTVEVYPPPDPNMPEDPVTPTEVAFTDTPLTLNVTFAAGETSKRISVLTEEDFKDEDDGTITLSVPAKAGQYKYIPGNRASATADVRDDDVAPVVSVFWVLPRHPFNTAAALTTAVEGGNIDLLVLGAARDQPLVVTLSVTEAGNYLDLDGEGAEGYRDLGNGKIQVTIPAEHLIQEVTIPLADDAVKGTDGSVTVSVDADADRNYTPSARLNSRTIPVKDNDAPSTVSISAPDSITEGGALSYTLTRTWAPGQSQGELSVDVGLAQTGDYITWPSGRQPDADGQVTIPVTFAARSLTATLSLETVDDAVSENTGTVAATILADTNGKYVAATSSALTTALLDNDPPTITVEAVAAEITEGADAQYRITRSGNTSGSLRVGLYVTGLPKIMSTTTEAIVLTSDNEDQSKRLTIYGAWVDYILVFAAGETEKTVSLTTEADSVNEGDGWLAVSILQRTGAPYTVGTARAQVRVKDDDIPTVSLAKPVGPTGLTLSSDGTTWEGSIVEGTQFTYSSTCTGVTEFSDDAGFVLNPIAMSVQYSNHPAFYAEQDQNDRLGYNRAGIRQLGTNCDSQTVTHSNQRFYVGPENGVLEIEIVPRSELVSVGSGSGRYRPRFFTELLRQYEAAAAEAEAANTLITKKDIFHPLAISSYSTQFTCSESDLRYCPQYDVGTVKKIRLTIINRDPTILIKAETASVMEGQPARFILERKWAADLLELTAPQSNTVVYLRASQDGQYITGALPSQVTFGRNETRKVIELQTVDDAAFGDSGSVTIELLPDTSTGSVNLHGKYTTWENWVGHTPAGGRSDRATVTITNNDDKSGITIAPAAATEGDSGSANMTFTLTLAQAVTEPVTVNYVTSDGTATAGSDYTAVTNGTATIPANSTSATFTVSVTGDTTDEANETFNVTISLPEPEPDASDGGGSGPPPVAIVGGDTATAVGTIMDDDPVEVTVAHKKASVKEGQDAVFVLTRTGNTEENLWMFVRLRAPGRVAPLSVEFAAAAATTEITVATVNNDLVDYPPTRDYTIEVLGDGDINGGDDAFYTPGDPGEATVTVTDDDQLQIVTVHPQQAFVKEGGDATFVFRRTGDTSKQLWITYWRESLHGEEHSDTYEDDVLVNKRFPPGQSEVTATVLQGSDFPDDQVANRWFPYTLTAQLYGDGQLYGVHRVWKAGTPSTAAIIYYDDDATKKMNLRGAYPSSGQVGETIDIDFTVLNAGSEATGNTITISSVKRAELDTNQTKPPEPRVGCTIAGPIAAGETGTCRATFTLTAQDLAGSRLALDSTASDGTTTSGPFRIYLKVLDGVTVGFKETTRLSVTEPAYGATTTTQAVLPVTRVGDTGERVQVAYTIRPIRTRVQPYPPREGLDYMDNSATPGVLTFGANETEKNIVIDILGDEIDEEIERFRVVLVPPRGVLVQDAYRNRVVSISDRAPPEGESYHPAASLELVSADPTPEDAGSVDFAVVLDREWGQDARFEIELDAHDNLTATPSNARLGRTGDFDPPNGIIHATIPAGHTRFEFSLAIHDDDVREEDETFQLLLSSSITRYQTLIVDNNKVLVTIVDNDLVEPAGIELSLTRNSRAFESIAENSSQRNITVTASFPQIRWPSDAADAALRPADPRLVDTTVRVSVDHLNSTASLADIERFQVADAQGTFREVESFDIVIPAGQTSGTTSLRFKPADNDVDGEDKTVILQGTEVVAADSDQFLTASPASFTITDDDTVGITVSPAGVISLGLFMREGETSTYTLVLDSEPTDTVTITVARSEDDLIRLTPETLTFTPSNWSAPQTISIESLDDGTDTAITYPEISHEVSGGDYDSVTVGGILLLIANTTQAYIYLEDAQASESDGYVEFRVSVRPILHTVPVVVRYTTVDGTAAAGADYTREVTSGQTYKTFSIYGAPGTGVIRIPITDNQVYGPANKTFTLQLTNHNNKALLADRATSLTATGTITDDDPKPVVSVKGPGGDVSYVSESLTTPVTFTLKLSGSSAADVTVDYATGQARVLGNLSTRQGITPATAGEDYTAATGTVTFSPGETTKQVTVQLTDDDLSEDTEFFGFKISNPRNAQLQGKATDQVSDMGLLDDDPRGVTVSPTSISLDEPAAGVTAVASSYTVKLNSKPTGSVTVTIGGADPAVTLSGGTLSNTSTLTFTDSNWNTAQTVTVTPVKDANGTSETITLTHTQSGGGYTGIAADSVTVNVTDSDARSIVLSETALSVTEGDDAGDSYTVKLATQPTGTVTVTIGGHAGTALSVSGTTLSNTDTLTFTASDWDTAQTVTVKAGEDGNADDESETLTHTASGGDYANVTKDLPVTVEDDAPDTVAVSFGAASYTVTEGSSQTITVSLDEDPGRTVVIPIETDNEGGASGSDYSGVPESVTFEAGDTSKTFDLSAAEDNLTESGEQVKLSFGTLPAAATAGTRTEATVSIQDRTQGQNVPTAPTVHFERAAYSVTEGASTSIKVILNKAPGSEVVIPISSANRTGATDADYTVPESVTFGAADTEKTITFAATDDTVDDDGEKAELSFGTLPGGITATSGEAALATVTIADNDDDTARAIVLSPASLTVTEEDETGAGYTVKLASQPTGTVTVTIGGLSGTDLILSGTTVNADGEHTLSFTASNWDTAQTVTVTSNHDADPFEDNASLLHQASGGGYDSASRTLPVTVTDDDTAAVVLTPVSITVAEGNTTGVNYTVKLSHAPSGTVKVTVSGHDGTALSVSGAALNASDELTFTTSNWDTAQTVTVKADTDDNAAGESLKLTHTPSGGGYSTEADLTVNVTDDDTAGIVLSETALTVTEGDDVGDSYTVKLSTQPSDTVTVTIGGHSGTALSVSGSTLSNTDTLTFTATNWDTAQTVTVKAGEDGNADDESETLTHTASGADYANVSKDLPVTVEDDAPDTVAVSFGAASYTVTEGSSQTITVSLDEDPERTVVIPIETDNEAGASDSDYTGVPESVTFDAGATSTTFDISATEDNLTESGEKVKLSFGTLPSDATAGTRSEATVSIQDRTQGQNVPTAPTVHFERAAYSVTEGASTSIKVILNKAPGSEVVIPISSANRTGATDGDYSVPESVTFGATDTEKTITFAATDDAVDDDGEKAELSFGTLPGGITATAGEASLAAVTVTITDNDDATAKAIVLSPARLTVTEEDETGAGYTVKLASQPTSAVTVTISGHTGTALSISGTTLSASDELTFTAANWDTAQTVTVKAGADADPFGESASLLHRASGGGYDSASKALPVTITDDDTATIVLDPVTLSVAEGNTTGVSYTVKLSHAPSGAVKVTVSGHDDSALSISGTGLNASDELTFTVSDWDTAQTVTVTADQDDNAAGESLTLTHTPSGGGYSTAADLTVNVTDDDTAGIVLSETALTVTEGDDVGDSYTVKLATQPSDTVTVTVGGHSGTALSISGTTLSNTGTLSFTASNWDTAQTVKVKAGDDANDDDESETLTHSASGADYANVTKDLPVTVTDDAPDTVTVSFGAASYTVTEGSSQTITVSLDEDPERTVVIPIETDNEAGASDSDYTGVPESVTFDAGATSTTFDISATEDNLTESGEKVKLSFGTLPAAATAGTRSEATVSIHDRTQGEGLPTPPTVHFENATYSVNEGASVAVKVKLSKAPGSELVIPISSSNRAGATDGDYSVPESVTFGATDTEKTISFAATDDAVDDDGEKVELSFGTLPGGVTATSGEAALATVTIADNDDDTARAIVLSPARLTVTEEDETGAGYTVKLASQPTGTVTVTIGGLSGTDLILSGTTVNADGEHTLSFTASNWDTAQTVTVKAEADADPFGESASLLHQASGGGYDSASRTLPVTITDDDTAEVVLTPESITVAEGNTTGVSYTVKLSHAPLSGDGDGLGAYGYCAEHHRHGAERQRRADLHGDGLEHGADGHRDGGHRRQRGGRVPQADPHALGRRLLHGGGPDSQRHRRRHGGHRPERDGAHRDRRRRRRRQLHGETGHAALRHRHGDGRRA